MFYLDAGTCPINQITSCLTLKIKQPGPPTEWPDQWELELKWNSFPESPVPTMEHFADEKIRVIYYLLYL